MTREKICYNDIRSNAEPFFGRFGFVFFPDQDGSRFKHSQPGSANTKATKPDEYGEVEGAEGGGVEEHMGGAQGVLKAYLESKIG